MATPMHETEHSQAVSLDIGGMTCATCVHSIEKALHHIEGVDAQVNLALERATVTFDPRLVTVPTLVSTITELGYKVRRDIVAWSVMGMDEEPLRERAVAVVQALPGIDTVTANMATGDLTVEIIRGVGDADQVGAALKGAGFSAQRKTADGPDPRTHEMRQARRRLLWSIGLTIPVWVGMIHMIFHVGPAWMANGWMLAFFATVVQWGPGLGFTQRAWMNLRHKNANMDVLVASGTLAAWGLSSYDLLVRGPLYFDSSATVITLILIGKYLEAVAKGKTGAAIQELLALRPQDTRRRNGDGQWEAVAVDSIVPGDILQILAGDRFPVDGVVEKGRGSADEAMLTGEPLPQDKGPGDTVTAGTVNGPVALEIRAQRVGRDTALAQIVKTVEEAQATKAPVQRFADRIANVFVPIVIGIALVTFVVWGLLTGSWRLAALDAVAVLVVACPCALGLATPTAVMVGSGVGAKRGILYRSGDALETASAINMVAFDKTGTLTRGKPAVKAIVPHGDQDPHGILALAAAIEKESTHPLAQAIVAEATIQHVRDAKTVEGSYTEAGMGIVGYVDDAEVLIGNERLLAQYGVAIDETERGALDEWQWQGASIIWVASDAKLLGAIAVADALRDDAHATIAALHQRGIQVAMLTGDQPKTAETLARVLGVDRIYAGLMPDDKARIVTELQAEGYRVLMVGDGINDAPALATADLGMAVGSGTDVAMETADVALMAPEIFNVVRALVLGQKSLGKIRQNLFWALIYNVIAIPLAALGFLSPIIAGAAMAMSSVSVVSNSLLLKTMRLPAIPVDRGGKS